MSTSLVIILIVALVTLAMVAALTTARSRARRSEANRLAAGKARGVADMRERTVEQARLHAETDRGA